jgi:hypothetical protein
MKNRALEEERETKNGQKAEYYSSDETTHNSLPQDLRSSGRATRVALEAASGNKL